MPLKMKVFLGNSGFPGHLLKTVLESHASSTSSKISLCQYIEVHNSLHATLLFQPHYEI